MKDRVYVIPKQWIDELGLEKSFIISVFKNYSYYDEFTPLKRVIINSDFHKNELKCINIKSLFIHLAELINLGHITYMGMTDVGESYVLTDEYIEYIRLLNKPIKKDRIKEPDHLYIIQNTVSKAYKIGRSKNPIKRLSTLNIASTDPLILVATYDGKGYMEPEIHSTYILNRLNTEWFSLNELDLKIIDNLIKITV